MLACVAHGGASAGAGPSAIAGPSFTNCWLLWCFCRSLLARKQGLLWAGSRARRSDRAGFVALPGGVGTLDELLDLLAIRQLNMHGSRSVTSLDHSGLQS